MRIHIVLFSLAVHFPVLGGGSGVVDVVGTAVVIVEVAGVEVVVDLVVGRVVVVDKVVIVVEGVVDVKIIVDGMSVFDIELFSVFSSFEEIECIFISLFASG